MNFFYCRCIKKFGFFRQGSKDIRSVSQIYKCRVGSIVQYTEFHWEFKLDDISGFCICNGQISIVKICVCINISVYRDFETFLSPCRNMDFQFFVKIAMAADFHQTFCISALQLK